MTADRVCALGGLLVDGENRLLGRWRQAMTLLTDRMHKPAQGHLIVIAGARVIQAKLTTPAEFRAWMRSRRGFGWVDDSWVRPLETMLVQT
ncbi:MAG TPA: hypothetical protein VMZ53_11415 [Kofleriaceae bacterium]|nr:hypothetical protein [Kofleriaceae bacterium]